MNLNNYKGIASIIVEKIIANQIKLIMTDTQINDIIMISDFEYEYKNYIFKCINPVTKYEPKLLNLQLIFKWYVSVRLNNYDSKCDETKYSNGILFGSVYQHYIGNDSDILILNSDLDSETLNEYHNILQIIYAYIRSVIENTYDSVILDYIKENDYIMITKYELLNQLRLEYDKNN